MATYVNFYTIAFENSQRKPTSRNLMNFFKRIEELSKQNIDQIDRKINGSRYRISSYLWPDVGEHFVIIPIGKVKNGAPYVESSDRKKLKELDQRVYDVNILAYDSTYNTMIMTNHQSAPSAKEVEDYFNSFLNSDDPIRIRILPIKHNTGIDSLRHAQRVRSVVFDLNLTAGTVDLIQDQIDVEGTLPGYFRQLIHGAKDNILGKTMKLEIGLGYDKKVATLDKTSLLDLIAALNIDSNIINEIEVRYYGGENEKIDRARIKEQELLLRHQFSLSGSKIGAEYLKQHIDEPYGGKYGKFAPRIREYFSAIEPVADEYAFVSEWNGDVVVN